MNVGQQITNKILVRNYQNEFPIITLCGSTKFLPLFQQYRKEFTIAGYIVLSPEIYGHYGDTMTEKEKQQLDRMHLAKISMSDMIFVINKNGYIGESTKREIEWAKQLEKKIIYLEDIDE
jgi:hypothetical protein